MALTMTPVTTDAEPFEATETHHQTVRLLKADNWTDERIARLLGISEAALTEHFAVDLRDGADMERAHALDLLRQASEAKNVAAIKEYIRITGAANTVEEFLNASNEAVERRVRKRPMGKKEFAREEALHAHEAGEWGEDLTPLPSRSVN